VLEQQVRRMLADPRAKALTDNFADQWLQLTDIENVNHDPIMFPEADKTLRQSLRQETELLFDSIRIVQPRGSADGELHIRERTYRQAVRYSECLRPADASHPTSRG